MDDLEERLQRYVVLTYSTVADALAQKERLGRDPSVLSVDYNGDYYEYGVTPQDPLFARPFAVDPQPLIDQWQWGLESGFMGFASAWDKTFGASYVAVLDSGIEVAHAELDGRWGKGFAYKVSNQSTDVDEVSGSTINSAGHGTHTASTIGARSYLSTPPTGYLNPAPDRGAGACWECTLMIVRIDEPNHTLTPTGIAEGLNYAITTGAQVVNMSLGSALQADCVSTVDFSAVCGALGLALQRQVVVVAAVGNNARTNYVNFPASDPRTIAVGGIDHTGGYWNESTSFGSNSGPTMSLNGVVAPARDVVSAVYTSRNWNASGRCGDQTTAQSLADDDGGGFCTGTSMATPHVSGIVALMRSVNPLATITDVKSRLFQASSTSGAPNTTLGHGVPNAGIAVAAMQNMISNRLTPLFAFSNGEYFYTTVPQMATARIKDTLRPRSALKSFVPATPMGATVGLSSYPGTTVGMTAQAWVFTTHVNPLNGSQGLLPLRRYVKCVSSPCVSTANTRDHAYATSSTGQLSLRANGYIYEGVEGYVYSPQFAKPVNAVALYSGYNATTQDYAVYPQSEAANMNALGFSGDVLLGYAYQNSGSRPVSY